MKSKKRKKNFPKKKKGRSWNPDLEAAILFHQVCTESGNVDRLERKVSLTKRKKTNQSKKRRNSWNPDLSAAEMFHKVSQETGLTPLNHLEQLKKEEFIIVD